MFYATIGTEILRLGRASSSVKSFADSSKSVIKRMLNQGAKWKQVVRVMKRTYGRHDVLKKFGRNAVEFVSSLQ